MLLLVGLGNPGARYARNRHNIGFLAVEEIARRQGLGPWRRRFRSEIAEGSLDGEKVLAMKPQTYMNNAGEAVGEATRFYKLTAEQVIVFHDELDLAPGRLRVKKGGGNAGHNGLRSIDAHIGNAFWRVRLGIGHPGDKSQVHGHVLGDLSKDEAATATAMVEAIAAEIGSLVGESPETFMSRVAQRIAPAASTKAT